MVADVIMDPGRIAQRKNRPVNQMLLSICMIIFWLKENCKNNRIPTNGHHFMVASMAPGSSFIGFSIYHAPNHKLRTRIK